MISSSEFFCKWHIRPAVAEIVPNRALMIHPKSFLLRFISPHDPAVQGFIELACPDSSLTDPVQERPTWDVKLAGQFGSPPFIRQEPIMVADPRAWRVDP